MQCTFCESPLPHGARYCPQCGTAVEPGRFDAVSAARPIHGKHDPTDESHWPDEAQSPVRTVTTSTTAILSLACGIAAWVILPVIGAFLAVIFGHQARREIAESRGLLEGDGLAMVGLALGYAQIIPIAFVVAIMLLILIARLA